MKRFLIIPAILAIPGLFSMCLEDVSTADAPSATEAETETSERAEVAVEQLNAALVEPENVPGQCGSRNHSHLRVPDEVESSESDEDSYDDFDEEEEEQDEVAYDTQSSSGIAFEEERSIILAEIRREKMLQAQAELEAALEKHSGDELKREREYLDEQTEAMERNLKDIISKTAAVVGLDANSSEPSEIIAAAKNLMDENNALRDEIDTEQQTIERLDAESERLNGLINAARKLAKDRQNRLSKPDLNCQVNYVDPNYSFVGLNAGIDNGGVVIGSELAVMRNGKQICVLKVTNAESKSSIAEVKKGSMLKGNRIKEGDKVVPVKKK